MASSAVPITGPPRGRRLDRRSGRRGAASRDARGSAPGTGSRSRRPGPVSTGSTAIEAIVSEPPTSASRPKTSPLAPSAMASGNSRSGGPKTSARTIAMTARATASSTKISVESFCASPSKITGTPLTTYSPLRRLKAGSATASRKRPIARSRSAWVRSGRRRTVIIAASGLGKRKLKRAFGVPGGCAGSKTTVLHVGRVVELRDPASGRTGWRPGSAAFWNW